MEIYGSTIWVNPEETKEWYQLRVISQWDWDSKAICFQNLDGHIIGYKLMHCTVQQSSMYQCKTVDIITDEMKEELINQGYTISNKV